MDQAFECSVCKACGCGVPLYNNKRTRILKVEFVKDPVVLFCLEHVPDVFYGKDDQLLTPEQQKNLIINNT